MGTASTTKILKQVAGNLTELSAITTSAGAADANAIPALNANGVLDTTILNATVSSAGVADAAKTVILDSAGKLDPTVMPTGIGADTASIVTSEALASGDFVNVWSASGFKVRKADATVAGKHAMGFVLASYGSGVAATVYFEGTNSAVTGQTAGDVFLSTTAGLGTATAPSTAGNIIQKIGFATSATAINFNAQQAITKA